MTATDQFATRVDEREGALFRETTRDLGTTPADALRMFIHAFNKHRGFPYDVRLRKPDAEPFETEEEATRFATDMAMRLVNETR